MNSNNKLFRVVFFKDGCQQVEEYQAIIGIKKESNGSIKLHIHDTDDLTEDFWRKLPTAMQQSIEVGLANRRKCQTGE